MRLTKFDTKNAEPPRAYEKRLTFADIPVCMRTNTSVRAITDLLVAGAIVWHLRGIDRIEGTGAMRVWKGFPLVLLLGLLLFPLTAGAAGPPDQQQTVTATPPPTLKGILIAGS